MGAPASDSELRMDFSLAAADLSGGNNFVDHDQTIYTCLRWAYRKPLLWIMTWDLILIDIEDHYQKIYIYLK